jgi:hypothetical protein
LEAIEGSSLERRILKAMEWNLTDKEYEAVVELPASDRYMHLIKRCADWEFIWGLRSDEGWVLASEDGGRECAAVWPHSRYAEACATGNWAGASAAAIEIHEWIDRWLSGLEGDDRLVEAFRTGQRRGLIVSPGQMREDLLEELANYE